MRHEIDHDAPTPRADTPSIYGPRNEVASMRAVIRLVCAVVLLCCCVAAHADGDSGWGSLKLYRTYHYVADWSERAHHFDVWFLDVEPMYCSVPGNTPDQIMALTMSDLECWWGGLAPNPGGFPPVPDDVTHLAEAIGDRMAELFPNASNLLIGYSGDFSTIKIGEVTPVASDGSLKMISLLSFAIFPEPPQLGFYGMQWYGAVGLSPEPAAALCDPTPCFVDFVMPPEIEGSCLVCGYYQGAGGSYPSAWSDLGSAVLATADAIDQGTYVNPIDSILATQGDTLLPSGLDQYAEYTIHAYLRGDSGREEVELKYSVSEVASGPVTSVFRSRRTGLVYRATLDLGTESLTTIVSTPTGEIQELSLPIVFELIRDGDVVAIDGLPSLEMDFDGRMMVFGGFGAFTRIDVVLDKLMGAGVFLPQPRQPYFTDLLSSEPR
jgi:hypothetical protein